MISYLEGKIIKRQIKYIILLVGGVGYKVFLSKEHLEGLNQDGEDIKVYTHLNVKEDALELYGFKTGEELELFELLITISGVGPKVALSVVAMDSPDAIAGAILNEDAKYMTKVSGIGLKTAQKIVIELKDKVGRLSFESGVSRNIRDSEVIDALETLGYGAKDAREALKYVSKDIERVEDRIKEALKFLGK
ncbi:MAG: Holliday junction branch migration protein RuvA [Patescibacteria group bacterium]